VAAPQHGDLNPLFLIIKINIDYKEIGMLSKFHLFLSGTAAVAESGTVCTTDFIVIPNPSQNSMSLDTDRFCGNALVPTTSKYSVVLYKFMK
jgi:hypothetical protein